MTIHGARRALRGALLSVAIFATMFMSVPAFAGTQNLVAAMSARQEVPPLSSPAIGACAVALDSNTLQITFTGTFSGLGSAATVVQVRAPGGPSAVAPAILTANTVSRASAGTFSGSGAVTPAQATAILSGLAYCEVGDAIFPGGEARGQLGAPAVPATNLPALAFLTVVLLGTGVVASLRLGANRREVQS